MTGPVRCFKETPMKTYKIYTSEGKYVASAKGDRLSHVPGFISVYAGNELVAVMSSEGGYVIVCE